MKILQVLPYFVPAWDYGGPVPVAYRFSENLVKRGHEVTVYTTDAMNLESRVKDREEIIDGIKVKRFKNLSNSLAYNHKIFLSSGMFGEIGREIDNFDIIHLHEYRTIQNIMVHHHTRKNGVPYIVQSHGALPSVMVKRTLKKLYDLMWGYRLLEDAVKVIALTETEAEQYKSMGVSGDKIEIVPNGIELSEYEDLPERGEFRKKYNLNSEHRIVLYLGRVHKTKGLDLLVKAFAGLAGEMDDARLVIVGPDEGHLSELNRLVAELAINEKVLFTGPVYERNKLAAYVDADIFVTPSFSGFPVAFMEACACGLPVVTTEKGDKLDWIDNQTGYVVAYEENGLKDAMAKILGSRDLAQKFGENARELVRQSFNWQTITGKLEQIYLEAVKSRQYEVEGVES